MVNHLRLTPDLRFRIALARWAEGLDRASATARKVELADAVIAAATVPASPGRRLRTLPRPEMLSCRLPKRAARRRA